MSSTMQYGVRRASPPVPLRRKHMTRAAIEQLIAECEAEPSSVPLWPQGAGFVDPDFDALEG